jgi:hypothetical protein
MKELIIVFLKGQNIKHKFVPSTEPLLEDDSIEITGTNVHIQLHEDGMSASVVKELDGKYKFYDETRNIIQMRKDICDALEIECPPRPLLFTKG